MSKEKMILGKDTVFSTDTTETQITNNVVCVGSSGSGKTTSVIIPKLLETAESSLVCSVSKRRIVDEFIPLFKKRGYKVIDINFAQPEKSALTFDPLQYITSEEDIAYLSSALVMNERKANSKADPYWDTTSINLLNSLISMTLMTEENATMHDVLKNIDTLRIIGGCNNHIETNHDGVFNQICKVDPNGFCATNWMVFNQLDSTKTASCILSSLQTMMTTIFTSGLRKQIATKSCVDIESIAKEKTVLFITTSPMNPVLNTIVDLFYGQIFKTLFETAMECPDYKLPFRVSMLFDDFGVGIVKDFDQYTSIIREANMDYTILLQSETQLVERYNEFGAKTILNNTDSYVFLGCNDYDTARNVSLRANIPVEDVLSLPIGKQIIFRRGCKPIFTQRYPTFEDERYIAYYKSLRRRKKALQHDK